MLDAAPRILERAAATTAAAAARSTDLATGPTRRAARGTADRGSTQGSEESRGTLHAEPPQHRPQRPQAAADAREPPALPQLAPPLQVPDVAEGGGEGGAAAVGAAATEGSSAACSSYSSSPWPCSNVVVVVIIIVGIIFVVSIIIVVIVVIIIVVVVVVIKLLGGDAATMKVGCATPPATRS